MPISPQITITPEDISYKSFDITAVTYTSTTATYTATGHTLSVGDSVMITGLAPDDYNGTYTITAVATNTFTVANTTNATVTDSSGNVYWADPNEYDYDGGQSGTYTPNSGDVSIIVADDPIVKAKIQTYYQLTPPTSPPFTLNVGDLWFDTDDGNKQYRWDGSNWISVQDGTIATKNRTYYASSAPVGTFTVGDIWFDTSTGNKPYRWNGSSWISVQDASIATALSTANAAQSTANGKNKVTYSLSSPSGSGTAAGDIWWQYNGSGVIIGQWEWNGSSWASKTIGSAVIANLDAGKITAGTISVAISLEAATITGGSININSGTFVVTNTGNVTITAGSFNINSGTFKVSSAGVMEAIGAIISTNSGSNSITFDGVNNAIRFKNGGVVVGQIYPWASNGIYLSYSTGTYPAMYVGSSTATLAGSSTTDISSGSSSNSINGSTYCYGNFYLPNHVTTAAAANAWINSTSGFIARSTASSQRYKEDIVNLIDVPELDPKALYSLPVRAFRFKADYLPEEDDRSGVLVPGFIAEEVDAIYPIAADYVEGEGVETWNDRMLIPSLLALVQDLNNRVKQLEGGN